MPIRYEWSPEQQQMVGNANQWLMDAIARAMPGSQYLGQEAYQPMAQPVANYFVPTSLQDALNSAIMSTGVGPAITFPEFKSQIGRDLFGRIDSGIFRMLGDQQQLERLGPGSIQWGEHQLKLSEEALKRYQDQFTNIMKGIKDFEKKFPQAGIFTEPIKQAIAPQYYGGNLNSAFSPDPSGIFIPEGKTIALISDKLKNASPDRIANIIMHEGTHGWQFTKPYLDYPPDSPIKNIDMANIFSSYNKQDMIDYLKNLNPYISNIGYFSNPAEVQAHGVANILTNKIYPEHEPITFWPRSYDKPIFDTIDYLMAKWNK